MLIFSTGPLKIVSMMKSATENTEFTGLATKGPKDQLKYKPGPSGFEIPNN
jgi:hypothetical protein